MIEKNGREVFEASRVSFLFNDKIAGFNPGNSPLTRTEKQNRMYENGNTSSFLLSDLIFNSLTIDRASTRKAKAIVP